MNHTINQTINETMVAQTQVLGVSIPFTTSLILDIYLITLCVAIFVTILNKYLTDQVKIKALRKDMKDLQKKMRSEMTKNPQKAQAYQKQIMQKNMENMKHALNPKVMLLSILPLLLVFTFVGKYYGPYGEFFNLGFTTFTWLGTYIVFSIVNSLIVKKIMNVA